MVKILTFSDLHTDLRATSAIVSESQYVDILVGDRRVGEECAPRHSGTGNHERNSALSMECESYEHVHVLHGSVLHLMGLSIFGLGYEIPSRNPAAWNHTLAEKDAEAAFFECIQTDIVVTHTPAFGHVDEQRDGTREGSQSVLVALGRIQPELHLCGHIHYSWEKMSRVGKTRTINLGPTANWFELY